MSGFVIFLLVLFGILLFKSLLIVPKGTVVKTFTFGRLKCSFCAGLHVLYPWSDAGENKIRLKIGTIGTALSESAAEFFGQHVPVIFEESPKIGCALPIIRFDGIDPVVTHQNIPDERIITCEKCGHRNRVR